MSGTPIPPSPRAPPVSRNTGCNSCPPTTQRLRFKDLLNYGPNGSAQPVSKPCFALAYLKLERSPAALPGLHCHPVCGLCSPSHHPLSKTAAGLLFWTLSVCPAFREKLLHGEHESPISLNST